CRISAPASKRPCLRSRSRRMASVRRKKTENRALTPISGRVDPKVGGERGAGRGQRARDLHTDKRMRLAAPRELHARELAHIAHEPLRAHDRAFADALGVGEDRARLRLGWVGKRVELRISYGSGHEAGAEHELTGANMT